MSKIKVAVIFGGVSSEHEVSLLSASSIIENIPQDKYEVIQIGITKKKIKPQLKKSLVAGLLVIGAKIQQCLPSY